MLKSTIKFDSIQLKEENGQFLVTFLEGDKPLFFNTSKMPDFKNGDNFSIVGIDGSMEYTLGGKQLLIHMMIDERPDRHSLGINDSHQLYKQ